MSTTSTIGVTIWTGATTWCSTMVALGVSEVATPHHTACQMDLPKSQILGTTSKVHRTFRKWRERERRRGKREGEYREKRD